MDIEMKVQILRACSSKKGNRCSSCPAFGHGNRNCIRNAMKDAATALSTLQAENEKLRETVDKYATAARVIALHLKPFCDESLPYDEMIADAARKASDELEQVKNERDSARATRSWLTLYGLKKED